MFFMNRADKIFLTIATLVVVVFSYLLYDDSLLFKNHSETSQEKIGNIYLSKNDVRLKAATAFSWQPAGKDIVVHQKDSIYTGERSEVSIHLEDGSVISLKENSMVTLNVQDGEMSLDLKYGDFIGQLNTDSKLKVTAGTEEFSLTGEKGANNEKTILQLNKSRSGLLDVKLQQGAAAVKTKKQTKMLEKNRSLSLAGKLEEVPRPEIQLLIPNHSIVNQMKDGDGILLAWTSSQKVPQFKIEISRDTLFQEIVWNGRVTQEKVNAALRSGDGEFFWRVKALSVTGQELNSSVTHTFKVVRLDAPVLTSPEKNQILSFDFKFGTAPEAKKGQFKIAWQPTSGPLKYRYQIASDTKFEMILKDQLVEEVESLSPLLISGEYFVRVRAENSPTEMSSWSEARSVTITVQSEQRPPAPRLVKNKIEFNPATAEKRTPSSNPVPTLAWEPPAGIQKFKIQIDKTKAFTDAKTYSVTGNRFDLSEYNHGVTYFRVYSLSSRGIASLPSEIGLVNVTFLDPKINPMKDLIVNGTDKTMPPPSKEMLVGWTPVPGAQKYLLEMAQDGSFQDAKKFEVQTSSIPVILEKPGAFQVRVIALNEVGKTISRYSTPEKFQYIYRVPLAVPLQIEPFDKTTVFMQQDIETFLWLEWKSVKDVKVYQLDISTSPNFEKMALSIQTKEPRFLVKEKLPQGKLYWRVRAISESPQMSSEWSNPREFSILFKRNETFQ